MEYLLNRGKSDSFNLGNGNGFSVREVIQTVEKIAGKKVTTVEWQRREGDPPILVGGSEKAKRILSWRPIYSDLAVIIESALKWHENRTKDY